MSGELRPFTTEELAEDAFLKEEHYQAHRMMNAPTDFEERKKAFVAMAKAREAAALARAALERRLSVTVELPEAQKDL